MKKKAREKKMKITFHVVTLFEGAFSSYLEASILKRATERNIVTFRFYNPRDFTKDKWARVDRRPYGGGPGMVLEAESVLRAVQKAIGRKQRSAVKVIIFEPGGEQFDTAYADKVAKRYEHVVLICGRYEGVDARVKKILRAEPVTIGPYILTGGELPALVVADTIARRVKGVLGNAESVEEMRIAAHDVYTRPETLLWKGKRYRVPEVLLSGNHKDIEVWKLEQHKKMKEK